MSLHRAVTRSVTTHLARGSDLSLILSSHWQSQSQSPRSPCYVFFHWDTDQFIIPFVPGASVPNVEASGMCWVTSNRQPRLTSTSAPRLLWLLRELIIFFVQLLQPFWNLRATGFNTHSHDSHGVRFTSGHLPSFIHGSDFNLDLDLIFQSRNALGGGRQGSRAMVWILWKGLGGDRSRESCFFTSIGAYISPSFVFYAHV